MTESYSTLTVGLPGRWHDLLTDVLAEHGTLGLETNGDDPVVVVAYFDSDADLAAVEGDIVRRLGESGVDPRSVEISGDTVASADWESQWRRTLSPIRIGRQWVVRPSWQSSDSFDRETLVIDPKMAFGTGTHATTHLCLLELSDMIEPGMSLLDVGTGTGILAIAAAKMGAEPVVGVEIDPVAIDCARENLVLNDETDRIELVTGTVEDVPAGRFDLISANVEYRTLVQIAPVLKGHLRPGGRVLFGGILYMEADALLEKVRQSGFRPCRVRRRYDPTTDDRWVSVVADAV
jgi:ribosomal protein L11 methyltransferase